MTQATAIETKDNAAVTQTNRETATPQTTAAVYTPSLDVFEVDDAFVLDLDMPGAKPDCIDVTCEGGVLDVSADITPRIGDNAAFLVQEYGVGRFERSVNLNSISDRIDTENIDAKYETGVLHLRIPKRAEATPRRIEVRGT